MRKKDPMMKCTFLFTADILVFINDFDFIRNFLQDRKGLSVYLLLILPFLIIFDLMNVSIQYLDDMMVSVQLNINSPYEVLVIKSLNHILVISSLRKVMIGVLFYSCL